MDNDINSKIFFEEKNILKENKNKINILINKTRDELKRNFSSNFIPGDREYMSDWITNRTMKIELNKDLEFMNKVLSEMYFRKVTLFENGKEKTYYIGKDGFHKGEVEIINWKSPKFANLRNDISYLVYNDQKIEVILHRQLFIKKGELISVSDLYNKKGNFINLVASADSFLKEVLKERRNDNELRSIIESIDDKQMDIVQSPHKSLLVQGVAGSGKTMIMLHKLSLFQYRNTNYDLSTIKVIVPHQMNFSNDIKNVREELLLNEIEFINKSSYFKLLLNRYVDKDYNFLNNPNNLSNEDIDRIYSLDFELQLYEDIEKEMKKISSSLEITQLNENLTSINEMLKSVSIENDNKQKSHCLSYIKKYRQRLNECLEELLQDKTEMQLVEMYNNRESNINNIRKKIELLKDLKREYEEKLFKKALNYQITPKEYNRMIEEMFNLVCDYLHKHKLVKYYISNPSMLNDIDFEDVQEENIKLVNYNAAHQEIIDWHSKDLPSMVAKKEKLESLRKRCLAFNNEEVYHIDIELKELQDIVLSKLNEYEEYIKGLNNFNFNSAENIDLAKRYIADYTELETVVKEINNIDKKIKEKKNSLELFESNYLDNFIILYNAKQFLDKYDFDSLYQTIVKPLISNELNEKGIIIPESECFKFELLLMIKFASIVLDLPENHDTYLCIDEAQEFSRYEYKIISLANGKDLVVNLYGDINQSTSHKSIKDWEFVKSLFKITQVYELNENYRNTVKIVNKYNRLLDKKDIPIGLIGEEVSTFQYLSDEVNNIPMLSYDPSKYKVIVKSLTSPVGQAFMKKSFDVMTVEEVKGLEFKDVIVVLENGMTKNEMYVATTRALNSLILLKELPNTIETYYQRIILLLKKNVDRKLLENMLLNNHDKINEAFINNVSSRQTANQILSAIKKNKMSI